MPVAFITLHLLAGLLSSGAALFVYNSYRKSKNTSLLFLMLTFSFLGVYGLLNSVPLFFSDISLHIPGIARIVALMSVFAVILVSLPVQRALSTGIQKQISTYLFVFFSVISLITLSILVSNYHTPAIGRAIVQWYTDPVASLAIGLSSLLYGFFWASIFFKDAFNLQYKTQHYKMITLGTDGILLGLAGFIGLVGREPWHTFLSIFLFIVAVFLTIIMLATTRKNEQ